MDIVPFSQALAQEFYNSSEQFPIDFDDAWQRLGYSTKQKAEQQLFGCFEDGLDFLSFGLKASTGGRPSKHIKLSKKCFDSWKFILETKKKANPTEKTVADKLAIELNGNREVLTEVGKIDVLTSTQVVEVKTSQQWKHALGQVLVYGALYPSHEKRIHLFGKCHSSYISLIEKHCIKFNVVVTFE